MGRGGVGRKAAEKPDHGIPRVTLEVLQRLMILPRGAKPLSLGVRTPRHRARESTRRGKAEQSETRGLILASNSSPPKRTPGERA